MNTITVSTTYDKRKNPQPITLRPITLEEAKRLDDPGSNLGQLWAILTNGKAGHIRRNGKVKRWKRNPNRLEVSFKYGLYENARFDQDEIVKEVYVEVEPANQKGEQP